MKKKVEQNELETREIARKKLFYVWKRRKSARKKLWRRKFSMKKFTNWF